MSAGSIVPAVNQVEFHPFLVQEDLLTFDARAGIQHEAWSPLVRGRNLDTPALGEIARKHGRTAAQVILRWDLQKGVVTIPKSVNRERILENSRIFDFTLDPAEMRAISGLENGTRIGPHPDNVNF
jgi:diketogulonate reductase-like aldo/keto reductase